MTLRRYKHDDAVSYTLGMTLTIELLLAHPQQKNTPPAAKRREYSERGCFL
jgi:hypothetical protein